MVLSCLGQTDDRLFVRCVAVRDAASSSRLDAHVLLGGTIVQGSVRAVPPALCVAPLASRAHAAAAGRGAATPERTHLSMMKAMQQMMQHSTGACCPQQQRCACRTPPAPQLCARPQQQHLATGNGAARRQHVVAAVAAPFAPQSSPSPAAGLRPEAVGAAPGQGALPQQQQQQQQDDGYESPSSSYDASSIQVRAGANLSDGPPHPRLRGPTPYVH